MALSQAFVALMEAAAAVNEGLPPCSLEDEMVIVEARACQLQGVKMAITRRRRGKTLGLVGAPWAVYSARAVFRDLVPR